MFIHQIYTGCLAQASYYIESGKEAAIIDPIREPYPYMQIAELREAKIRYIFETHFHADFVSGHIDLAEKSGAKIIFGPNAKPEYPSHIARDNEEFTLGKCKIRVLHTPGHTIESSCFLLIDETGKETALFTGDTLFVGDVGRPDLMSGSKSKTELASMMYDSLNSKIKILADDVLVYPGHGAGSACGKNLGTERYSTIGQQKKSNYALQEMPREQFIKALTDDLPNPPAYFFKDAGINIAGYRQLDIVLKEQSNALSPSELITQINHGCLVLDTRNSEEFGKGFIPGSINIGLEGEFAPWVGTLININQQLILVTDKGKEAEAIVRLARIGFENIKGYLEGGFETWLKANLPYEKIETIDAPKLSMFLHNKKHKLLDVRRDSEVKREKINAAFHIPLEELEERLNEIPQEEHYLLICKGGYRSMIASSILLKHGFDDVINCKGGVNALKKTVPELVSAG